MKQVPIDDFERRYQNDPDPWRFATSAYELRRFDITAACVPEDGFRRGFEPGCAGGELTVRLARRGAQLVSWDGSPTIVAHARRRLEAAAVDNVELAVGAIPARWPTGRFDLVVLSEIGYYFDHEGLADVLRRVIECLDVGGTLLATHWLGASDDHLLSGDEVHAALGTADGLAHVGGVRDPGFRIDWWRRA